MAHALSDMKRMFAAKDCQVYVFKDGDITVINSAIESGAFQTRSVKKAREILLTVSALGDSIPWEAVNYFDGLEP